MSAPSFQAADLILPGMGESWPGFRTSCRTFWRAFIGVQVPFRLADFASVTGIKGNVSGRQARATIVMAKEVRRIINPNALIFVEPVVMGHNPATDKPPTAASR